MFRGWFKPITKKNARYAAVIILIVIVWTAVNVVKELGSGMTFDDIRPELLFLLMFAFIEYGMITIAFSKEKPEEEKEDPSAQAEAELISADNEAGDLSEISEAEDISSESEETEFEGAAEELPDDEEKDDRN